MINAAVVYDAVNVLLALASLVGLILLGKFIPSRRVRIVVAIALILIILTSPIYMLCMRVFKLYEVAYAGEMIGKVEKGTFAKVMRFRDIAVLGHVFEFISIALIVGASKVMLALPRAGETNGGTPQ
ncbi:MAG: hypothetical protein C4532_13935 [Candidatus Abyssobacteria bacterium SURF_17]|jgi:hypothetical protein|uniref:Uncharacterized protein n=1 Tax=Candidatus Abyssobacteria bacterium SURF_17 TaxID=2093361 RepID=A0A419EUD3_9BACT|nr:MAG: hypothetical protein C4532_13935 [Candidatus Abyssubacteria bacterium SURF_17]